ncbi:SAM-dependent methyltransferase [Actinomycetospora endophytica]|uniref:SAM-dependent methyltransferase n=1 Tax=Actinomycetospora endophytica TaxID=2291215 RepID=A0ABS8PFM3_9PSEU|nr:SAM-dependent methyltransferase [Actinomycetospora endophytica]MCD2196747.1 SAM-dependent methyltransferase [Actinomycetospora endophytica]
MDVPLPRARLSAPGSPVCTPDWLGLREPADHAARAGELADRLADRLGAWPGARDVVVRDVGCGTGSMGRWLAPRLARPQRWVLQDRDADLAHRAAAATPVPATALVGDLADDDTLAGTDVLVCSALLDLLTASDVEGLAARCAEAGCAALLTLSVTGVVALDPVDPLDDDIAAAFDAHQRRDGRLGPDAPDVAEAAFARHGYAVHRRPSPWRLGPGNAALVEEWLRGRIDAACAQDPALLAVAEPYLRRRLETLRAGNLYGEVGHADLLALPGTDR